MYKTVKPTTFTLPLALIEDLDALSKEIGKKNSYCLGSFRNVYGFSRLASSTKTAP